jgi:hypothetical protein
MGSWIFIFGSPATPMPLSRETGIAFITGFQDHPQNMLAQVEGQAKADGIDKLGHLQDQITAPNNGPEVVLSNLGKHAMWSS